MCTTLLFSKKEPNQQSTPVQTEHCSTGLVVESVHLGLSPRLGTDACIFLNLTGAIRSEAPMTTGVLVNCKTS